MALKALMLRKKLNDAQKALEELRAKSEDFAFIGLSLAGRIAEHKIELMRLEAGLPTQPTKAASNEDPLKDWEDLFKQD